MSSKEEIGLLSETSRKIDFKWKIINFFSYVEKDSKYYSPQFYMLNSKWEILMYPNGQSSRSTTGYLGLFLNRIETKSSQTVDFSFSIKAVDNTLFNVMKTSYEFVGNAGYGYNKFIERSTLQQRKERLVPLGNLTIICTLTVNDHKDSDARHKKLAEDFLDLYTSQRSSDATLKINDENILVHKSILAARSPVFAAMFENEMKEKKTGTVIITDCDPKAFNVFLLYLYSGETEFKKCNAFDLYKITDKYQVPEFKMMCIDFMIQNLTVENIFETFVFSQEVNEKKLQSFTQQFFCENFKKIIFSNKWNSLLDENRNLANDLLKGMAEWVG